MKLVHLRWIILIVLLVGAAVSSYVSFRMQDQNWSGFLQNLGTELIGALLTYALFELILERREAAEAEKQALERKKRDLRAQLGSSVKDVAVAAAEELWRHGWVRDGSLVKAFLGGANLAGVHLYRANLEEAYLIEANLQGAYLGGANLYLAELEDANLKRAYLVSANLYLANLVGADLARANLEGANLIEADLSYANLVGADLARANLIEADLFDADLEDANLIEADVTSWALAQAKTLKGATMPDGRKYEEWKAEGRLNLEAKEE